MPAPAPAPDLCPRCGYRPAEALNFCPSCGSDLRGLSGFNDTLAGSFSGRVIAERYRILEKIGEGGMGSVYKVEHVRMGKAMALKLMRPGEEKDDAEDLAVDRFVAEARIVSRLTHINTISVFDFGETDDGWLYIAMEYCPGRDLAWLLRAEGRLPERRAVQIVCQVLRSLAEAHDAGVIHRDIKPGNVMLLRSREGDDFVKVLDFGIAKLAEARPGRASSTGAGDFVGTPNYMPPEQARGQELTASADLYATGAMLFELVTGRIPFLAPTPMGIITAHVTERPPSPREVAPDASISAALEAVILKSLEKDPANRYQSADEMRVALEAIFTSSRRIVPEDPMLGAMTGDLQIASRGDFQAFEAKLRRDVLGRRLVPMVALVALVAGGTLAWSNRARLLAPIERGVAVEGMEQEPNNDPNQANAIRPGVAVTGHMTGRFGREGDTDTFVVAVPPGDFTADVSLTGIPDINLELDLYDAKGRALAKIDQAPAGQLERITPVGVKDHLYVQVHENLVGGGTPKENTIDAYRLRVDLNPRQPDFEVEPNAEPTEAMVLTPGHTVGGIAGARGGRDAYRMVVPQGSSFAGVAVSGVPGVNLALAQPAPQGKPESSLDEHGDGLGEVLPLTPGEQVVFVDTVEGVDHENPYRIVFFSSEDDLTGFLSQLEKAGRYLDAAGMARRTASRFPRSPAAPDLLWTVSEIAGRAAARMTQDAEAAVGFELDARRRREAFLAMAPVTAWKEAGVPLRYQPGLGFVYDNEALRKLIGSYAESPLAERALAELIRSDWEKCGAAAVVDRALAFLARYPRSDRAASALLALGQASEDLATGKNAKLRGDAARAAYKRVVAEFPSAPEAKVAGDRLTSMGKGKAPPPFFPCD